MSLFQPLSNYQVSSRDKTLDLSQPHIMGILNVTPDSFSDGGQFNAVDKAVAHCQQMINEGATIIDIGGESTRPNAQTVATDDEIQRVVPVVRAIRKYCGDAIWLSIDTSSPEVMQAAFNEGADIWNDVRALKRTGAAELAAELNIPVMLMHMRGEPTTMNNLAQYDDVIDEVRTELIDRINEVVSIGVKQSNIIIDPGFGFAKNYEHHCALLSQLSSLQTLGLPMMFGISRKRFLAEVLTKSGAEAVSTTQALERDSAGTAAGLLAVQQGASIIRTHNVAMMQQAVALWSQLSAHRC
ncbi:MULTISPECIES: dihydropteroate synthase [Psychrobacter]|jgi:dihydropteroate synthase|uniref:dihydropteroate synthase n=1 Tax=Psychrobacter TaxID=497 RepID=UPI00086B5721|nr:MULTISPECIES: dihydropteroate synthase [Psychrobacter]MBA6244739.1 dihydropteroate synthase [Psychrobacter sp. Urea-trap-18]MBA6285784.1 dihydropteroate synthase [Psychrobacter sp. Urea-trap-16]MBA6318744.1 dihydropteroate synthase [Psychrobacter sp. Urea-trap-20]MBA6334869.1 dihydropteroate synthase [Psychrobacter sp. Urea-trap-19]OEH67365.1 MAG: dihydropteroate synthase [Psychrobacter sp. B29-1]|tara:strand:- start:40487 stop:41380 length:894 start_codon:yes stop_codon:yes gene_type:complete